MANYTTRTLTYELIDPGGAPVSGATITASLQAGGADLVFGEDLPLIEVPRKVQFTEDPARPGFYSAQLVPNTAGLDGTRYRIEQRTDQGDEGFYIVMPDENVGPTLTAEIADIHEVEALSTAPESTVLGRIFSLLRTIILGTGDIVVTPDDANRTLTLTISGSRITTAHLADGSVTRPKIANDAVDVDKLDQGVVDSINAAIADVQESGGLLTFARQGGGTPIDIDLPVPSDDDPLAPGTATPGTSADYSRADHVHPAGAGSGTGGDSPADDLSHNEVDELQAIAGAFDNAGWTNSGDIANRLWDDTQAPPLAQVTGAVYSPTYRTVTWAAGTRVAIRIPYSERNEVRDAGKWRVLFDDTTIFAAYERVGSADRTDGWYHVVDNRQAGYSYYWAEAKRAGTGSIYAQQFRRPVIEDLSVPSTVARVADRPRPETRNPQAPGTPSPGNSRNYSRGDHRHPLPAANTDGFSIKGTGQTGDANALRATGLKSQSALPPIGDAADGDRVIVGDVEYARVETTGARNVISGTLSALSGNRLGFDGLVLGSRQAGTPASYLLTVQILTSVVPAGSRPGSIWVIATNHSTGAVAQDDLTYTAGSNTSDRWGYAGGDIRIEASADDVVSVQVFTESNGGKGAPLNVEAALAKWVPTGASSQEQPTTGGGSATVDQASVYTPAKDIIQGGHGVKVTPDDTAETLTLDAEVPSGDELPDRSLWTVGYDFDLLAEDTITHDYCGPGIKHSPDTITYQFTGGPNNAPAFIISYSPEYSGSGSAVVAGKTFVAIGGTYTMPSDAMLTAYFEGDARTQYAVTQARADATLPSWHEVPTLSYATLNRPGFRLCRNFSSASTSFEIYPSVAVPAGAKVYAGAGHGDAGWVNRPGVAAPWATQGMPEPRTLLALTTFVDGPGQGLTISNSSSDVTPAVNFFNYASDPNDPATIGQGAKFILGDGDGRLGTLNVEANLTIPPNLRSDQQIGFGSGGNDLTWRLAGWVTAQTGLTASVGVALTDGNVLDRVGVYRGSTRIGEVRLTQDKAADDQGGYRLVYDGASGSYNFSVTSNVEAFFVHNDGPAAGTGGGTTTPAPAPFDTVLSAPAADVVIAVPLGDTWYPVDDPQGNEVWQTIETITPTAAQAGRVLFLGQIHAESSHSNGGGDRIYYQTRLMMRSASGADSEHVRYIRNSGQQDVDFQAITRIGTDEIVAEATVAAGQNYDLQARVLAQVNQAAGQTRTVTFDNAKNYLKMVPIGRAGGAASVTTRGALWATSSVLTSLGAAWTNAASAPPDIPSGHTASNPDWTIGPDAPAGVVARNNASQYRLGLPSTPPDDCCNGFWVVSEVSGAEVEAVFIPWTAGLTHGVSPTEFAPHTRVPLNLGQRSTGGSPRNFVLASLQQSSGGAFQLRIRSAQNAAGNRFANLAANTRIKVYAAGAYTNG